MRLIFAVFVVSLAILQAEGRVALRSTQKAVTEASSHHPVRLTRSDPTLPSQVKTVLNKLANVPEARTQKPPSVTVYPQRNLTNNFARNKAELSRNKAARSSTIDPRKQSANIVTSTIPTTNYFAELSRNKAAGSSTTKPEKQLANMVTNTIPTTSSKTTNIQEKRAHQGLFTNETSRANQERTSKDIIQDPLSIFNPGNGGAVIEGTRTQRHLQPGRPAPTKPAQVRTNKSTTTSNPKTKKVEVKKPIPKFNEVDYDEDFQAKMMKNPTRESRDDDDGNEDDDFNLDDYDFDFNHDEFSGRGKPLQPRIDLEKKKAKCEKCAKTTARPSVKSHKNSTRKNSTNTLVKQNNYAFVLSKSDLSDLNSLKVEKYVREAGSQESEEDDDSDDDDSGEETAVTRTRSSHSRGHDTRPKFTLTP